MKILIEYYTGFLDQTILKLNIPDTSTTDELLQIVSKKTNIPEQDLILRVERDGFKLQIIKGWDLYFYQINHQSHIIAQMREPEEELQKLGLQNNDSPLAKQKMPVLFEENEEEDELSSKNEVSTTGNSIPSGYSQIKYLESLNNEQIEKQSPRQFEYIAYCNNIEQKSNLLELMKTNIILNAQNGNLKEIEYIYDLRPQYLVFQEEQYQWGRTIEKQLRNHQQDGWNALHHAINSQKDDIAFFLLKQSFDINEVTSEGFTPLQLAVHHFSDESFLQFITQFQDLDINKVTQKETALHHACRFNQASKAQLLIAQGASPEIENRDKQSCQQLQLSEELFILIQTYHNQTDQLKVEKQFQNQNFEKQQTPIMDFKPPRPPIIKGILLKQTTFLFRWTQRYVVVDPDAGTFIRYKSKQDCPKQPIEVIPLSQIFDVKATQDRDKKDGQQVYIWELLLDSRQMYGSYNKDVMKQWVSLIYQAVAYCVSQQSNLEQKQYVHLKEVLPEQNQVFEILDENSNFLSAIQKSSSSTKIESPKSSFQSNSNDNKQLSVGSNRNFIPVAPQIEEVDSQSQPIDPFGPVPQLKLVKAPNDNSPLQQDHLNIKFKSFKFMKILGKGGFGKVYLAKKLDTRQTYAIKALSKQQLILQQQLRYAVSEGNILQKCDHPFILCLHYAFQTPWFLYMALDFCSGGDLASILQKRYTLEENEVKFIIAELLLAIEYLHKLNIIYRDLKPENILISKDGHIQLADFGLSKENMNDEDIAQSFCGSPAYLSPEMLLTSEVGKKSDIYGIGAVMYELLMGDSPFYSENIDEMYKQIKQSPLILPKTISVESRDLLKKMLQQDPTRRIDIEDVKKESFFQQINWSKLYNQEYDPPNLKNWEDDQKSQINIYIDENKIIEDEDYDDKNVQINRVKNYTFSRESA